jgi:hypothetical protein
MSDPTPAAPDIDRRELFATALAGLLASAAVPAAEAAASAAGCSEGTAQPAWYRDKNKDGSYPPCDEKLRAEIDAVLRRTEALWNAQEWWKLPEEVWDRDDPSPMYVAEELYDVMIGWPTLDKYIFPPKKGLEAFRWGYANLWVKELAPGLCLALYDHWFEIKLRVPGPVGTPRAGFDRVLSIYRRTDRGWRQSLYAQCPLGPDTYIRRALEKLVRPDFNDFVEDIRTRKLDDPRLNKG